MSTFKDHFSANPAGYADYRPRYPEALFDWLAEQCAGHNLAWDCATGSGQAAVALAGRFERVIASDASATQIEHAEAHPGVDYRVALAEACGLPAASVDLLTVAQAAHWFDLDAFYGEARRVLKPGGVLALWGYEKLRLEPALASVVGRLYHDELDGFWPPERALVESGYRDLAFPFVAIDTPEFAMTTDWSLDQLIGYFGTWSAVKNYRQARGTDPLPAVRAVLEPLWGSPDTRKNIQWPLFLRVGRI
ncbi:MAG: class I SAM-dependent methyltransferase [Hydrogenophilales bacterium]|nr:class I SAM-dependent methyltransferase [Hydrogenophilales bacterium]